MYRPNGSGRDLYLQGGQCRIAKPLGGTCTRSVGPSAARGEPPCRVRPAGSGRDMYLGNGIGKYYEAKERAQIGAPGKALFNSSIFDNQPNKRYRPQASPEQRVARNKRKQAQQKYMQRLSISDQVIEADARRLMLGDKLAKAGRYAEAEAVYNGVRRVACAKHDTRPRTTKQLRRPMRFKGAYAGFRGGSKFDGTASHTKRWH